MKIKILLLTTMRITDATKMPLEGKKGQKWDKEMHTFKWLQKSTLHINYYIYLQITVQNLIDMSLIQSYNRSLHVFVFFTVYINKFN